MGPLGAVSRNFALTSAIPYGNIKVRAKNLFLGDYYKLNCGSM